MVYDFQRASMTKRIPAWILDFILLITLATGFLWAWSHFIDIAPHTDAMLSIEAQHKAKYDGQLKVSIEEYEKMTEEEKIEKLTAEDRLAIQKAIEKINEELFQNDEYLNAFGGAISSIFSMIALSCLCAYFILDFLIPLWLKNGQTIGKKCFGVALMRKDGIKVTPFMMFTRTILGKCSVELMFPAMLYVILGGSVVALGICAISLLAQIIVPLATRNKTAIHDLVACTVAVDMSSQMIFDSVEEMEAYNAQFDVDKAFEDRT